MYEIGLLPQSVSTHDCRGCEAIFLITYQHSQRRYQSDYLHNAPEREEESRDHLGDCDGLTAATALRLMNLPMP